MDEQGTQSAEEMYFDKNISARRVDKESILELMNEFAEQQVNINIWELQRKVDVLNKKCIDYKNVIEEIKHMHPENSFVYKSIEGLQIRFT